MVEIVYAIIRIAPQRWWIIAWAVFVGLFLLMAQLAPVVLLPIFYKFQPLENDALRERLTKLGERAGTRVRGVYEWKLSEKSKKANAALTGIGSTTPHHPVRHAVAELQRRRDRSRAGARTRPPCAPAHPERHLDPGRNHLLRILADQPGASLRDRQGLVSRAGIAALRFRQPAADRAGRDPPGFSADAGPERDLAPPRARGRPLRVGEHSRHRAVHHLDAEAGRPEPGRARALKV